MAGATDVRPPASTRQPPSAQPRLPLDRALRAARRARRPACSTSRADTAVTRASSPAGAIRVVAVDRDAAALATLAGEARIETATLDLEGGAWPLPGERFGAIVVTNYLHRPLFPFLLAALEGDGVLLYETFARGNEAYGRPTNPDFLLRRDELWQVAERRLTVVAFEQGRVATPPPGAVLQRLAAVGPDRRWPPALPAALTADGT